MTGPVNCRTRGSWVQDRGFKAGYDNLPPARTSSQGGRVYAMRRLTSGELLLGRFRTTIPWLAKLSRSESHTYCRQGWDRTTGTFMSEFPYFAEDLIIRLRGALLHKRPNLRLERVDLRVWVRPGIDKRRFIKGAH